MWGKEKIELAVSCSGCRPVLHKSRGLMGRRYLASHVACRPSYGQGDTRLGDECGVDGEETERKLGATARTAWLTRGNLRRSRPEIRLDLGHPAPNLRCVIRLERLARPVLCPASPAPRGPPPSANRTRAVLYPGAGRECGVSACVNDAEQQILDVHAWRYGTGAQIAPSGPFCNVSRAASCSHPPSSRSPSATMASAISETHSASWASDDEVKEKLPDASADVLEKGSLDNDAKKPSVWKRVLVGNASADNATKRAMQSRHLTMIGEA